MKRALITGGAGFLGFHLANLLSKSNCHVTLMDDFSRAVDDPDLEELLSRENVDLKKGSVLDKEFLDSIEDSYAYIFHFAAIIGVSHVLKRPFDVLSLNNEMLVNMLDFAKKREALERFVFTSTSEIYAGTLAAFGMDIPTPESTPLTITPLAHPRTSYMLSKIYGEALCLHSGVPCTIVRPHNVYGPRMGLSHVVPELLQKMYKSNDGDKIPVFSVNHKRTFCYVEDAVRLIEALAKSGAALNDSFNLGIQGPEISIGELAETLVKTVGKDLKIEAVESDNGSPSRRCPSMEKTNRAAGTEANIQLEEGIRRTYAWYRENIFASGGKSAI